MEALGSLLTSSMLARTLIVVSTLAQAALSHPPPPPIARGNFSSQRQEQIMCYGCKVATCYLNNKIDQGLPFSVGVWKLLLWGRTELSGQVKDWPHPPPLPAQLAKLPLLPAAVPDLRPGVGSSYRWPCKRCCSGAYSLDPGHDDAGHRSDDKYYNFMLVLYDMLYF